jgi:hypothetical protein
LLRTGKLKSTPRRVHVKLFPPVLNDHPAPGVFPRVSYPFFSGSS